jgi:transcriptional regulator with XRE-family HTH domain
MTELLEGIGHNIRRLRDEKGWNQTELGFRAGTSPSIISLIENGKRNPSTTTLAKIAGALGVEVVDLFPKAQPRLLEAFAVGGQPAPTFKLEDLPEEARTQLAERGFSDPYFVPLEEGEEEDTVTLEFRYVRLLEEGEPILKAMREASPEEADKIRQQLERAGRTIP